MSAELGWLVVLAPDNDLDTAVDCGTRCRSLPEAEDEARDVQTVGTVKIYKVVEVAHYAHKPGRP